MGQGNIIGKPNLPATTGSRGLWSLREQYAASRESTWPGYDPQWANTTLLVKTAPGVTATDSSAYLTYGTPTFSTSDVPYAGIGLGSVTLDTGSAQESVYVTGASMAIGNGNFTAEAWVKYTNFTGGVVATSRWTATQSNIYWYLGVTNTGRPLFLTRSNGFYTDYGANSTVSTLSTGVWYHMAGVREGGVLKLYINGVLQNVTQSDGGVDLTEQAVSVGFFNYTSYTAGTNATISGFRLTKSAVYTANFTPPTTKPTALANNVLLLNFDGSAGTFTDETGKNTLTSTATVVTTPAPRFGADSMLFSGSNSITTTATAGNTLAGNFAFGTGDFTIEAWIYPTSASGDRCIFSTRGSDATAAYFAMYTNTYNLGFGTNAWIVTSTVAAPANAWSHAACVRANGVVYLYLNGVCVGSAANATNLTDSVGTVGRSTGNNNFTFIGQLDEVRVTKAARYTGNFTPPTAPFDRDWEPPYNDTLVTSNVLQLESIGLAGATNNVFRDDSTNNFLPVRFGDTTQGSLSPYIPTGYWSAFFDGTGDYLTVAANAGLQFATSDFTIECWVNKATTGVQNLLVWGAGGGGGANDIVFYTGSNNELAFYANTTVRISGPSLMLNKWHHIAAVRQSGTTRLYIDGIQVGSWVDATSYTANNLTIGWSSSGWNGHVASVRVVKGTAVYTGSTFTPPTAPLTAIANTSLLTLQDNRLIDRSTNNLALTRFGDVSVNRFSPFPFTVPVTTVATTNPGSVQLAVGNYLSIPANTAFDHTGDVTVEAWVYRTADAAGYQFFWGGSQPGFMLLGAQANRFCLDIYYAGSVVWSPDTIVNNRWYHIAGVKTGSTARLYVDGVLKGSATMTGQTNSTQVNIGNLDGYGWPGFVSNLRFVKGTSVYTAAFTPPTAPLTAISGTTLLACQSPTATTDSSTNNFTLTKTGTVTPTDFNPFVTLPKRATYTYGGSGYFDGTGDYLTLPTSSAFTMGTGDFTVECWVLSTGVSNTNGIFQISDTTYFNSTNGIALHAFSNGAWYIYTGAGLFTAGAWVPNAWYHCAVVRSSGVTRLYVNGVAVITQADTTNYTGTYLGIGGVFDNTDSNKHRGFISNLRVVKGTAVYTAAFTPPTAPVTAISGTSLLLNFDNAGVYDGTGRQNIITLGTASSSTVQRKYDQASQLVDGTISGLLPVPATSPTYVWGTGDFTIEFWVYRNTVAQQVIYDQRPTGTQGVYPTIYCEGANLNYHVSASIVIAGPSLAAGQWYHVAVSRAASQTRMFVNGTQVGATYADTNNYINGTNRPMIGNNGFSTADYRFNGYIENLRISRVGRYTANFTVPSESFPVA